MLLNWPLAQHDEPSSSRGPQAAPPLLLMQPDGGKAAYARWLAANTAAAPAGGLGSYQQPPRDQQPTVGYADARRSAAHQQLIRSTRDAPVPGHAGTVGSYLQPPTAGAYQQPPPPREMAGWANNSAGSYQQPPTPLGALDARSWSTGVAGTTSSAWLPHESPISGTRPSVAGRTSSAARPPVPTSSWATTPLQSYHSSRAATGGAAPEFRVAAAPLGAAPQPYTQSWTYRQPPPPLQPPPALSDLGLWLQPLGCLEYEEILRKFVGITDLHDMMKAADKLTVELLEALGLPRDKALAIWQANGGHRSSAVRVAAAERAKEQLVGGAAQSPRAGSSAAMPIRHGSTLSLLSSYAETAAGGGVGRGSGAGTRRRSQRTPHPLPAPSSPSGYSDTESESDTETEEDSTDDDDDDFEVFTPRPSEGVPRHDDSYPPAETYILHRIEGQELGLRLKEAHKSILILEATGIAADAGLRAGQTIVMVQGVKVQTANEVRMLFHELPIDQPIYLAVRSAAEPTDHRSSGRSLGAQLTPQLRAQDTAFRPRGTDSATTWAMVR